MAKTVIDSWKLKCGRHDLGDEVHWYQDGDLHRIDGPAVTDADGGEEWWVNGQRHREDGPAVTSGGGSKFWYSHGKCHRVDGPAVVYSHGYEEWWLDGKEVDEFVVFCYGRELKIEV